MADRRRLHPLRVCAVMAALWMPCVAVSGPALDTKELRATLRAVAERMPQQSVGQGSVAALRAQLGFGQQAAVAAPKPVQGFSSKGGLFALQKAKAQAPKIGPVAGQSAAEVSVTNFRLMLATLSQTYTGKNNLSVITAQGPRGPKALSVRSGTVTLADLQGFGASQGMAARPDGTLTAPVVLWPDATLVLRPGERLAMARDTGAFLLSMGRIEATGAVIEAVGPENPHEPSFAPFVTVMGGGSIALEGSTLRGLGFGRTAKFSGLTIAGNPLMPSDQDVVLRDTLFEQIRTVTIAGVPDATITGNTFRDARGAALTLHGAPRAEVRENLFHGKAPTNSIRIEVGSDHTEIAENVFLAGDRVAMLVDGGSNYVVLRENLVWKRNGAGIKFLNVRCGRAQGNILIDNVQKGIEVRKSNGVVVQDNLLAGNNSAGVWVSAQAQGAQTTVQNNIFEGNAAGLSSATGAEIWIAGNNFTGQLPKLLDGDISLLTTALVRNLGGSAPLRFARGRYEQHDTVADLCGSDT